MQFYETVDNRVPSGGQCQAVIVDDGVQLRVFKAPHANPRGTVLILNGRAEFFERYFETMRDLQARGFSVVAFDWRGQGGSQRLRPDRNRGYVRHFRDYERDLQAVLKACVDEAGPLYALAHSTGGLVLLNHLRKPSRIAKAVISAPLVDVNYDSWPRPIARLITKTMHYCGLGWAYLPGYGRGPFRRNQFDDNPLTSDRTRWDRDMTTLEQHPELGLGGPTYSWLKGALDFIDNLKGWPRRMPVGCPVLLIAAGNEAVVHARAARQFAEDVAGVSYLEIADAKHEILNEKNMYRRQFWSAFDSFVGTADGRKP
jgi:lysophospholipase